MMKLSKIFLLILVAFFVISCGGGGAGVNPLGNSTADPNPDPDPDPDPNPNPNPDTDTDTNPDTDDMNGEIVGGVSLMAGGNSADGFSLAVNNNIPYVAYRIAGGASLNISSFNNSSWSQNIVHSSLPSGTLNDGPSLHFNGDTAYIASVVNSGGEKVWLFDANLSGSVNGTSWKNINVSENSVRSAKQVDLTTYNSRVYVTYNHDDDQHRVVNSVLNGASGDFSDIGNLGNAKRASLVNNYIAYASGHELYVKIVKVDVDGNNSSYNWGSVGNSVTTGVSDLSLAIPSTLARSGPYVAYISGNKDSITVKKHTGNSTGWVPVGNSVSGSGMESVGLAFYRDNNRDIAYVVYTESSGGGTIRRLDGSDWKKVGTVNDAVDTQLAFDSNGNLYVAYVNSAKLLFVNKYDSDSINK